MNGKRRPIIVAFRIQPGDEDAKSLNFYEFAQNPYHVDVLYTQACSEVIPQSIYTRIANHFDSSNCTIGEHVVTNLPGEAKTTEVI